MFLKVCKATAKPDLGLFVQQLGNERIDCLILHVFRKLQRILKNLLINFVRVLCIVSKWHEASHKLIKDDSQRPQIDW